MGFQDSVDGVGQAAAAQAIMTEKAKTIRRR